MWWIINVITAVLLICNVVPKSSNKETYCYGDICNRATDNQFCSDYFKMCRNCADIIMDCGTEQQPSACTPYCINYKTELELQNKKGSNCTLSSSMLSIAVNTTRKEYQQGDVIGVACEDGYEPHYTDTAQCGELAYFISPLQHVKHKAKTCTLSPTVANAYVTPKPDSNGRFPINTTVTVMCEERFTLFGVSTMKCLGDGKWTETAPFCLGSSYIWWYNVGVGLVAICATLFIVVVLSFVILWQHHQRIGLVKQKKETSRKNSVSSAESGVDVNENDEDETSPMMNNGHVTVIDEKDRDSNSSINGKEASNPDIPVDVIPSAPSPPTDCNGHVTGIDEKDRDSNSSINGKEASNPDRPVDVIPSPPPPTDCNPESNPSGVTNHNTNCTNNIIYGDITNQTDNIKVENNDDKNDYKPDRKQPEEEHVPEKTPTEESQTTVVALQETKDRTCKGARPIIDCSDTDIALDSVPKCLKKLHVDDCS